MKRMLVLVLCMVLTASILAGCGTGETKTVEDTKASTIVTTAAAAAVSDVPDYMNAEGYPIVKDKITYKAMGKKNVSQGPWGEMTVIKKMEQITNISFEWDTPLSDIYNEKKNLTLNSGDLPDIFIGGSLSVNDEENYGQQKVLIPLEDLIEKYMPNFKKIMENDPSIRGAITASDGHIYSLPYILQTKTMGSNIMYINMKWLENVGMTMPNTVEELYNVLKAFKEKDPNKNGKPDEIPVSSVKSSSNSTSSNMLFVFNGTLLNAFSGQAGGADFDIMDGKVVYNPIMPYYKDYLEYLNKLYKDGLVDPEIFTQTSQNMFAKGKEGRIGVLTTSMSVMLNSDNYDPHELLPPLTSAQNNKKVTTELNKVTTGSFAITSKCKYPEAIMRWVDVFYTTLEENVEGIYGLSMFLGEYKNDFEFTDDTKTKYVRLSKDPQLSPVEYQNKFVTPGNLSSFPAYVVTDAIPDGDPFLLIKATEMSKHYFPYMKPIYPVKARYTKEETEKITFAINDIKSYLEQMTAKFIIGEEPLDKFDEYVSNLKKMGIDDLIKIKQDAYNRYVK